MTGVTSPDATPGQTRVQWIDTARGIGIVLVVYAHALRGLVSAKMLVPTAGILLQDHVIYAFHMPLFFLLSGLFAGLSAANPPADFVRKRIVTIDYPYFLWSVAQTLISIAAHQFTNRPASLADLSRIAWEPIDQFWFLYVLAICHMLLLLPRRLFYLLVPLGLVCKLAFDGPGVLLQAATYLPFFAVGVWLTAPRLAALLAPGMRAVVCLTAGGAVFALLLIAAGPATEGPSTLLGFLLAGAGIVATLGLARLVGARMPVLPLLGAASLPIFLLHVIAAAAARAALKWLSIIEPAMALPLITAAGLLVPLVVYQLAANAGLSLWLGLGYPPASPKSRPRRGGVGYHPLELALAKADVEVTPRAKDQIFP